MHRMATTHTRRRKRTASNDKLLKSAEKLFDRNGYEDTTLEAVAEDAGLHVQTLYRHFPSKSELAFALLFDNLRKFEEFFEKRKKSALDAWRDWIAINARAALKKRPTPAPVRISLRYAEYWHRYETVLAQGIAEDMGVDVNEDLRPMLIACMLVGANKHMAAELRKGRSKHADLVDNLVAVVDTVIAEFSPLLTNDQRPFREHAVS